MTGVVKMGAVVPVTAELLRDVPDLVFDFRRQHGPPSPEPTEPEIERLGDDYWMVLGDTEDGVRIDGVFRTEAEAVAFWRALDDRRYLRVVGDAFDVIVGSSGPSAAHADDLDASGE